MVPKIGYLIPTREAIMEGHHEAGPLLRLAEMAEDLEFDSVWIGDSLLARPRHEPITWLSAVAGRTKKIELGTAVILPALRNPVLLANQIATLDQASEGRVILGVGIATDLPNIRAEFQSAGVPFEDRVGRMLEGLRLCRALWSGNPVDWDGRWKVEQGILGPVPVQKNGLLYGVVDRSQLLLSVPLGTTKVGFQRVLVIRRFGASNGVKCKLT